MIDYMLNDIKNEIYELEEKVDDLQGRIRDALDVLFNYGQTDGEHHKTWAIDQVVRILCGCYYDREVGECMSQTKEYRQWIDDYCYVNGEQEYEWDCGIAP